MGFRRFAAVGILERLPEDTHISAVGGRGRGCSTRCATSSLPLWAGAAGSHGTLSPASSPASSPTMPTPKPHWGSEAVPVGCLNGTNVRGEGHIRKRGGNLLELEQDPANPLPAALPRSPYLLRLPKALPGSQGFPFPADLVLQETLLPTLSALPAPAQTNTFITPNSRAVPPRSFRDVNPLPLTSSPAPFPELLCIHHPQRAVSPVSPPRGDSPAPRAQPQAPSCGNACDKHKALPSTPKLSFRCRVPPPHFSSTDFLPLAKGLGRRMAPATRCAGRAGLCSPPRKEKVLLGSEPVSELWADPGGRGSVEHCRAGGCYQAVQPHPRVLPPLVLCLRHTRGPGSGLLLQAALPQPSESHLSCS